MRRAWKVAVALAGAVLLSACSHGPVVLGHPNPPPPPGYKVICATSYGPFVTASTGCRGVLAPDDRVILHAKG